MSLVKFAGVTPRKKLPRRKITGPARDRLKKCIERDRIDAPPAPLEVPTAKSSITVRRPPRVSARRTLTPFRYAIRRKHAARTDELERQMKELIFNTLTQDLVFLGCDEETNVMRASLDVCNRISQRLTAN